MVHWPAPSEPLLYTAYHSDFHDTEEEQLFSEVVNLAVIDNPVSSRLVLHEADGRVRRGQVWRGVLRKANSPVARAQRRAG